MTHWCLAPLSHLSQPFVATSVSRSLNNKQHNFLQSCPQVATAIFTKSYVFQNSANGRPIFLATFVRKFVTQKLSKIAKSGHTDRDLLFIVTECIPGTGHSLASTGENQLNPSKTVNSGTTVVTVIKLFWKKSRFPQIKKLKGFFSYLNVLKHGHIFKQK